MPATKRILKTLLRPIIRQRARQQLEQLRDCGVPAAAKIAKAVDEAVTMQLSGEEKPWVDRIERLRQTLSLSQDKLSIVDFGAGAGQQGYNSQQMQEGVMQTKTVGEACRASKPPFWSLLLFKLVRQWKPMTVIELGTCLGISAAYQAAAQKLNGAGRLATLEGAAALAPRAQNNLKSLGLENATVTLGKFCDTLEPTLSDYSPVDYAFIDGHHDEHATLAYYEQFRPHLADSALLVFDDIAWSPGMRRAWETLQDDPNVSLSIDFHTVGVCVVTRHAADEKRRFAILMPS
jgi:predicted O-methyltransferase YrrM